jgi:nitroimidazol reductase NimA-like FMN-containing flavoprotein (pyridoxamine 5'-phosphate oxidase superfamily)
MALNIDPEITSFLKRNHVAVLATSNKETGTPHAATIFYATDSQTNLYFLTKEDTAKSKNLTTNPRAAIVVYEAEMLRTAQISGSVSKVDDPAMMEKALRIMAKFSKQTAQTDQPPISKLDAGEYILYRLTPQSIRLGDYKYGSRNFIFEIATPAEESLDY